MSASNQQSDKSQATTDPGPLYESTASTREYGLQLATDKLGRIVGTRSDGAVCYQHVGWGQLEWLQLYDEAKCEGLPTISLPRRFRIVAATVKAEGNG
jgi:hypothetical protein